ncbi:MAG: XdhC family protein [Qingshengfaniella sp.]
MNILSTTTTPDRDPINALLNRPGHSVAAFIAGVEGPSYRPVGALMAVFSPDDIVGTLSSGCVEADIALNAMRCLDSGMPQMLRYGRGSPFVDIQLPCGGGLDILLVPHPDKAALARIAADRRARTPCTLEVDSRTGAMRVTETGASGMGTDGTLRIHHAPDIRFLVFGKGPEASTFAALVQAAGYPNMLLSPDDETLTNARTAGCPIRALTHPHCPTDLGVDDRTAVILFFHDHDWEPPILHGALATSAFYIGAQGSRRARDARHLMLEALGTGPDQIVRLHGPVGLIPSARDAGTLAVSVLAEILTKAATPAPAG